MNLQYKGVNSRGRAEWVDLDIADSFNPEGVAMEEWVLLRYRPFVEETQAAIGRDLTKAELRTIHWLAGYDKSTIDNIMGIIKAAHMHGKSHR
ncbi:hypothetical protein P9302_16060 [Brevibacillus agri]|uniref:hypothetical protein n=1 Tax=Brevibacillus agri TaxID=51101 RepID=UPI002E1EE8B8|nr:hypothetical protein [Brevibacillus agri]